MFSFEKLEQVQVEITNRCQASCPMCLRNIHGGIENPSLQLADWTIDQFKHIFNEDVLNQIKHVNFCGDFGDPIINNDLLEMCRYLKEYSSVSVDIHTNGSARSLQWWELLAKALPTDHKVEFALDGLKSDTHALYRIGTDYDTIIRNAMAFIKAGGNAHWMYIKFKHNEYQVDTARNLATTLGFNSFTVKNSKRFGKKFPVLDRTGEITHYIEQPTNNIQPVEFVDLKDYKSWNSDISCFTLDDKELYIDAHGHVLPCCLIGSFLYANYDVELYNKYNLIDSTSIIGIAAKVQLEVFTTIEELGGLQMLDANTHRVKDIMSSKVWQTLVQQKWTTSGSAPCTILCSSKSPFISIADQTNRDM
jgi:hypothetical protein